LMLGFQAIASAARAGGVDEAQAFLDAFHMMFRLAGIVAASTGVLVAWSARRRAPEQHQKGL
jgi:hypothetical protein